MSRISGHFWRIIAMVAVVTIHAAGPSEWIFLKKGDWLSQEGSAVVLSQLARFSVPLFIVLSGYGLATSELGRRIESWSWAATWSFWARRSERVVLPYIVWSLGTLAYMGRLWTADGSLDWSGIGFALLSGAADYHLYFVAFLLQGYVLWPILRRPTWTLVVILLLLQFYFASPTHVFHSDRFSLPGWLFIHWAGYFALGARLASLKLRPTTSRWAWIGWALSGVAVMFEYGYWADRLPDPGWFNHFSRYVVIAFSLCTVWLWVRTAPGLTESLKVIGPAVQRGSTLTFCVYFIHVWLLRWVDPYGWGFAPKLLVGLLGAFGVAWCLDRGLSGSWTRWPRRCLGL